MVDLLVLSGSRAGASFGVPDVPIVVGRSPEANVRIDDPWISNMHALVERRGGELWVVDLGSRNGTFVDDQPVTEARLVPGATLAFGRTRLELRQRTSASAKNAVTMRTPVWAHRVVVTAPHQPRRPRSSVAVAEPTRSPGRRPTGHPAERRGESEPTMTPDPGSKP